MNHIVVIGGGIVGLSSAYYLRQAGNDVTVLEQGDFLDNCSYGNMGYVCPGHYIPLASPGKVRQGIKWMFNPQSPFYIRPSLNRDVIDWGVKFMRSANDAHVNRSNIPLRDLSLFSQNEYQSWHNLPEFDFAMQDKGLLEIFNTSKSQHHAEHIVALGQKLNLETELLNQNQLQQLEKQTPVNALGAIHFKCDSHIYPNRLMADLQTAVSKKGVRLAPHQEVTKFERSANGIAKVITKTEEFPADQVVIAAGSWSKRLAAMADVSLPLMPGRGYSTTVENGNFQLNHPAILMERSVALTPLTNSTMRFGGTMEVVPVGTPPRYRRMQGIVNAVNEYFPQADFKMPEKDKIWFGYRPCSADGLPYIGRAKQCSNLLIATGHSMLGMSLGAGTGKLIAQIANEQTPDIDLTPFAPGRFD